MIIQNLSFKKWNEDSYEACLNSSSVPKYNCAIARELPFSLCRVTYSCQSEAFSLQNLFRWRILLVHHLSTTILHLMTSLCRGIPTSVWQLLFLMHWGTHEPLSFDACLLLSQLTPQFYRGRGYIISYCCPHGALSANLSKYWLLPLDPSFTSPLRNSVRWLFWMLF